MGQAGGAVGRRGKAKQVCLLFFLGPRRHHNLPQERDGEGDLPLQVEPEWRNEL